MLLKNVKQLGAVAYPPVTREMRSGGLQFEASLEKISRIPNLTNS
jgi:hypothetical protein